MSRCYLDTNFLYAHLRARHGSAPGVIEDWRKRATSEMASESGVISALVLDELAYRLVLAWLRDDGTSDPLSAYREDPRAAMRAARRRLVRTWKAVDALGLELRSTDQPVVEQAKTLMVRPGLTPRDAFHAAHALAAECTVIVSSDETFDRIPGLRRLAP